MANLFTTTFKKVEGREGTDMCWWGGLV